MVTPNTTGRAELAALLQTAAQEDGPIRLLKPSSQADAKVISWLFPNSRGKHGQLIKELLGTMLKETVNRPRMVVLTELGVETLLRNTPQKDRPDLLNRCADRYREPLLLAWQKFATRGEEKELNAAINIAFRRWLPSSDVHQKSELDEFRELFAQEIANSWSICQSEEARNRLAHLMKLLGAEPLEKKDEIVVFTGMKHTPLEPLFKGDSAKVVKPGWLFPKTPTPLLLVKAEVLPDTN